MSDKALDSYLEGLKFARKANNLKYISSLQHNIALIKRKLGKYEEAKTNFKKSLTYLKLNSKKTKNDTISYLMTISELVTTYRQNTEIDSASYLNDKGFKISKGKEIESLFRFNEGIIQYYSKEYQNAINNINEAVTSFSKPQNRIYFEYYNLIEAYLFIGKSYNSLSQKEQAMQYFKKIDSIVEKTNYIIPQVRTAYIEIIDYYKSIDDRNNQLYYIDRLLFNDSILDKNYRNVNNKLIKEYDTPILLSEKEKLITKLKTKQKRSNLGLIISLIITVLISILLILNHRKSKRYKMRFDEMMKQNKVEKHKKETKQELNDAIGIDEEVVHIILKGLDHFETNKGFLETNIKSGILAKKMNTNSKYLTKVIKYHKGKNFSPYINDLRIDYIIEELKADTKLQKYTIKALASEAGFNSTEVFSKSFFKKTGIYPSYFVKQIQKKENLS